MKQALHPVSCLPPPALALFSFDISLQHSCRLSGYTERHSALTLLPKENIGTYAEVLEFPALAETEVNEIVIAVKLRISPEK